MAKDWKKQTRAPIVGMIRNPYFVFTDSFDTGTTPTLLDSKEAQKVVNFIRALMLGRVHITTGNPLKNLMEFHLSKENGLIDLQIKTALINDLDPYLGNHLNLEGYNLDARDVSGTKYQQHGGEGLCISGGQSAGIIRLLSASSNGVGGGSGFKDGGANVIWQLPNADGSVGQVLSTDGSSTLSWVTNGGGGGGSGTVTSVATSSGTFINITGGDPSPITTTGTISGDLSATGSASSTTFLRGDNTWAVPAGGGGTPAGSYFEIQMNDSGSFGGAGVYASTSGELQLGSASGTEAINLNVGNSIIAFGSYPSSDFSQGIQFYYGYRICESGSATGRGLSLINDASGSDILIMDAFSGVPYVGANIRSVSFGHATHTLNGNMGGGAVDAWPTIMLRGNDPAVNDNSWVQIKAQSGTANYTLGLPDNALGGVSYRENMGIVIDDDGFSTESTSWKSCLIANNNSQAVMGTSSGSGLFLMGTTSGGVDETRAICNGDKVSFQGNVTYQWNGLGGGASGHHQFLVGDGVTSVAAADGTFVNLAGGTITTTGTLTPDLSATGTANSTTFLRGDNTWAVPSGGGGSGMTSFDFSDPNLNSFSVTNSDTVTIDSSDGTVSIDCSTSGIIDLSASGGGGGSGTVTSVGISSFDGSVSITGSPITSSGTIDLSVSGGGGSGTVTSVSGTGTSGISVTGSPITTSGTLTIDLDDTLVTPATYGDASNVAQITIDQQGRITSASSVAISGGGGGGGMTSFDISDQFTNSFTVADADTVEFTSTDNTVTVDCSTSGYVDFSTINTAKWILEDSAATECDVGNGLATDAGLILKGDTFLQCVIISDTGTTRPEAEISLTASGTASSTTFLRGDNTWATPSGGGGGGSGTVTSVATTSGTFVNVTGGTITSTGTITGDLSATGTASSTTFLRGDNTWAVPAGGGSGMTSFTISDGSNSFTVVNSDTVEFTSADSSVVADCSTADVVDLYLNFGPSDERLKKNIVPVGGLLQKVEKLQPVEFDWNEQAASTFKKDGHEIGLVAQEVEKVFPELIGNTKDFKSVEYSKLIPILVDCIKDLSHQVRILNEKVDDLEFKNLTDQ